MSWFTPLDHQQALLKEAETLKSQAASLAKDVARRQNLISEARQAGEAVAALHQEVAQAEETLLSLQLQNELLEHEQKTLLEGNQKLSVDIDLLRNERTQAERLAVSVGQEIRLIDERLWKTRTETDNVLRKMKHCELELSAVDEVSESVAEMRGQVSQLKTEVDAITKMETQLREEAELLQENVQEEEAIHEALIAKLAEQHEVLREYRQRSALAQKAQSMDSFFSEASTLLRRAVGLVDLRRKGHAGGFTNSTRLVITSSGYGTVGAARKRSLGGSGTSSHGADYSPTPSESHAGPSPTARAVEGRGDRGSNRQDRQATDGNARTRTAEALNASPAVSSKSEVRQQTIDSIMFQMQRLDLAQNGWTETQRLEDHPVH
jgi:hypothetical protein